MSNITRPDWGVPADAQPITQQSADALAKEIATSDGPAQPPAVAPSKTGVISRPNWDYNNRGETTVAATKTAKGDAVVNDPKTNLPLTFMQEMLRSADGLEANIEVLTHTLDARLNELTSLGLDRDTVIAGFDKLSAGLRHKFLRTALHNPHLAILALLDKAEPLYTLAEAAEAESFLRGLR